MNQFLRALSKLLEPEERECVCGDLEELQLNSRIAAASLVGLALRRHLALWSGWAPWLALLGVAGLTGSFLSGFLANIQTAIFLQVRTYNRYGVAYEPGGVTAGQQIAYVFTSLVALWLWFWACGFVLRALSGRALWMTGVAFYLTVQESWAVRMALAGNLTLRHGWWPWLLLRALPLDPLMIALLLALALGIRSARKDKPHQNTLLALSASALTLVLLVTWMQSWFTTGFARWSGQPYQAQPFLVCALPLLAAAWPVLFLPLIRKRQICTQ